MEKLNTYIIESRVSRTETITIKARDRKEALNKAETAQKRRWKKSSDSERQLISIS